MKKRFVLWVTMISIAATLFSGCGSSKKAVSENKQDSQSGKKVTLKYWVPMEPDASKVVKNYGENDVYKELEKRTGVHIEFIHPAIGQEQEQFNLMISSKDLPDIIQDYVKTYPGGPDKAIDDGIYLRLNELIAKDAPNYTKLRESNKEIARQTITDKGNIYSFPCIQADEEPAWFGLAIRKDWLDELKLKMPETVDEWHEVLKAFKEKKGCTAPLIMSSKGVDTLSNVFISAYDATSSFFVKDGAVKYGPVEPGFKDYLALMNQWFNEGLIDRDFATRDWKSTEALFSSGKSGALTLGYGEVDTYYASMKSNSPNALIAAAPSPALKPGQQVHYRQKNFNNKGYETVVTSSCKNPDEAVKWLDYAYSDEGAKLFNYGVENVSYKMVDGKPQYTDLMTKNPQGLSFNLCAYKYKLHIGPYKRDWRAFAGIEKYQPYMDTWSKAGSDYVMPLVNLTADESKTNSSILNEVNTFKDTKILQFILGKEPLSKFDDYVAQIKQMKIDDAIKIQQAAYDRYNKR